MGVDSVMGSVTEAISSDSWGDVQPLLPPSLTVDDACELVQHLVVKKRLPPTAVPIGHVVLSRKFVESIATNFEKEIADAAQRISVSRPSGASKGGKKPAVAAADADDDFSSKKKGKKAGRGKKNRGDDDDEEDGG